MKAFIWIVCVYTNAMSTDIFKENGILLGAIPTVALFSTVLWLARTLCKKWDEHKRRGDDNGQDQ